MPARRAAKPDVVCRCSMSRPGVATITSTTPPYCAEKRSAMLGSSLSRCGVTLDAPMIVSTLYCGSEAASFSACVTICVPSSRALLNTSARTGSTPLGKGRRELLRASRSKVGRRKANVFPVPVLAFASTSEPARQWGRHSDWIGVSSFTPASARACTSSLRIPGGDTSARVGITRTRAVANFCVAACHPPTQVVRVRIPSESSTRSGDGVNEPLREGQLETTHANAYRVGHYHTKHCHAAVVSLGGLTHR